MITLYKFGEQWGISDPSPFCVKLESFLRINDIDYSLGGSDIKSNLEKAPKKKMPFIEFDNGELLGDSNFIIERLCADNGIDMDASLTTEQKAQSYAFRRMLDEGLYFVMLYSRWIDAAGWNVMKPLFFGDIPAILRSFISNKIRKEVINQAYEQGVGRHSPDEIYDMGVKDMKALSDLLGDNKYFFGSDKPTRLDIWVHAYVIEVIQSPIENKLKENTLKLDSICAHAKHMQELIYTDKNLN